MHLLREGQFSVASTFLTEATAHPPSVEPTPGSPNPYDTLEQDLGIDSLRAETRRKQFANMYHILHELKAERNLKPAIEWARANTDVLEARGSNLEFELGKLQFVWLFMGGDNKGHQMTTPEGKYRALDYARREFAIFQRRYLREIQQLGGAMAFCPNLQQSPYRRIFHNDSDWDEVATSFTREFCSLLGLSADSPLYIAATAGAIALPTLLKLQTIMKEKRTEWTTQDELPVRHWTFLVLLDEWDADIQSGRDPFAAVLPFPLDLRLPRVEGTDDGRQPAHDDAVRSRRGAGVVDAIR